MKKKKLDLEIKMETLISTIGIGVEEKWHCTVDKKFHILRMCQENTSLVDTSQVIDRQPIVILQTNLFILSGDPNEIGSIVFHDDNDNELLKIDDKCDIENQVCLLNNQINYLGLIYKYGKIYAKDRDREMAIFTPIYRVNDKPASTCTIL